jgi:hypothetical protein
LARKARRAGREVKSEKLNVKSKGGKIEEGLTRKSGLRIRGLRGSKL